MTDLASDPFRLLRVDESLSMAFLVLLQRLTPVERAVFLLREVFDYEYSEIAAAVNRSEANCRQIFRRAQQHVHEGRPRFTASEREHEGLLQQFLATARSGDVDAMVALLSGDVVLHTDGGGKATALPNLIHGVGSVARVMVAGLRKLASKNVVQRIMQINGGFGVVSYLNGKPHSVLTVDASEDRIRAIYIVTNPDKLSHLPAFPA